MPNPFQIPDNPINSSNEQSNFASSVRLLEDVAFSNPQGWSSNPPDIQNGQLDFSNPYGNSSSELGGIFKLYGDVDNTITNLITSMGESSDDPPADSSDIAQPPDAFPPDDSQGGNATDGSDPLMDILKDLQYLNADQQN